MSEYTTKTAKLKTVVTKAVVTETNRAIIGENTNINKDGIDTNNITADLIKTHDDDIYLTKTVADSLYSGTASSFYEWIPDLELKIQFSLLEGEPYTVPTHGWFVVNEKETNEGSIWTIFINQRPMFHSDSNGLLHVQILVKMGDMITSNSSIIRSGYFMPCASELRDWRVEELKSDADIWKNAVVHNADGTTIVRDQWLINLEDDNDTWGYVYGGAGITLGTAGPDREFQRTIHIIKEDEAFDLEGNHLFYVQTENILQGSSLFNNTSLTSFNGDLSSLTNGYKMFYYSALESFNGDLSSLTNGTQMFFNTSLTSFSGDLSSLTNGNQMFYQSALESFNGDLSSLTDYSNMFYGCTSLTSFNGDLSSLTNGTQMFNGCTSLTSFNGDLSSLTNGTQMFNGTALESFSSDLSSLTDGSGMFNGCKLNLESIQNIANTIKTVSSGSITISIQSSLRGNPNITTAINTIRNKGWTVTEQYN